MAGPSHIADIRKTTLLTRMPPDRIAQKSGPATSICHGIGVPSAEADDTKIDMKPQQEPSTQEVLAGLVERVTFHNHAFARTHALSPLGGNSGLARADSWARPNCKLTPACCRRSPHARRQ